jgi:arsenate reductase
MDRPGFPRRLFPLELCALADRPRVLFLCTGNACRSQMAEGWLRALGGERFESLSAGTRPAGLHPGAVAAMAECGVDISGQRSKSIEEFTTDPPELVISVCDAAAESCPDLPGRVERLRWSFPDPAAARGDEQEVRALFRSVRDAIRAEVEELLRTR